MYNMDLLQLFLEWCYIFHAVLKNITNDWI